MHINIKYMLPVIVGAFLVLVVIVLYIIHMAGESKPPKSIVENDQVFTGSGENTVVFYYTDWCPSCKNIRPIWEQAKAEVSSVSGVSGVSSDIKFVEVNTDTEESPDYVQTVPTIMFQGKRYNNTIDFDEFYQFLTGSSTEEQGEQDKTEEL